MSGTTTPPTPSPASGNGTRVAIATWAPLGMSFVNMGIFGAVALFAWLADDKTSIAIIVGAAIGMAKDASGYWFSSNAGSRAKDDRAADQMDRQAQALAVSVPAASVPPAVSPADLITALKDNTAATVQSAAAATANTTATTANTSTQGTNP